MTKQIRQWLLAGLVIAAGATSAEEPTDRRSSPPPPTVDLVIALDVSGSMDGLIDSAKQRLWDVVNELGRAQPQPQLRVALVSFGRSNYAAEDGYVKINQPFTSNLDLINQQLFSLSTNGGEEYVARVVSRSLDELQWTDTQNGMRIMFVAGNEAAVQDPKITLDQAIERAIGQDVVLNMLYCGDPDDHDAVAWMTTAQQAHGMYASIDQQAAAVAAIETPMDKQLNALNEQLNQTYIAYGVEGEKNLANQVRQDSNAASMSASAKASRVIAKAGGLYRNVEWDLVDAVESGQSLKEIDEEALPEPMRDMTTAEKEQYVTEQSETRAQLKQEIAELDQQRAAYIAQVRKQRSEDQSVGLDDALKQGLRKVARDKGLTFNDS